MNRRIEESRTGESAVEGVLSRPAEEFTNDSNIEELWLMRAVDHSVVHFNILCSVDPAYLNLSSHDDRIYEKFREKFPKLQVNCVSDDILKNEVAKVEWRQFCEGFKGVVEDYNFATLLRLDSSGEYNEENTTLVPRIQFLAIEVARNREGCNHVKPPLKSCCS